MWILFALIAAVLDTGRMAINTNLSKIYDSDSIYFFMYVYSLPVLAVLAFFTYKDVPLGDVNFLVPAAINTITFALGTYLLIEANKRCDLSIVAPIIALTPIFIVIFEGIFLETFPKPYGFIGIFLIVAGGYILNFSKIRDGGIFAPLKSLLKKNAGLIPFITAVVFAVCATSGKASLKYCDPFSFPVFMVTSGFVVGMIYLFVFRPLFGHWTKIDTRLIKKPFLPVLQGTMYVLMLFSETQAFKMILASYVIAIKRTSALFGVGTGYLIFKDKNIRERALGAFIMVAGVAILSILG